MPDGLVLCVDNAFLMERMGAHVFWSVMNALLAGLVWVLAGNIPVGRFSANRPCSSPDLSGVGRRHSGRALARWLQKSMGNWRGNVERKFRWPV
jgi:hypothetical protein